MKSSWSVFDVIYLSLASKWLNIWFSGVWSLAPCVFLGVSYTLCQTITLNFVHKAQMKSFPCVRCQLQHSCMPLNLWGSILFPNRLTFYMSQLIVAFICPVSSVELFWHQVCNRTICSFRRNTCHFEQICNIVHVSTYQLKHSQNCKR